VPGKNTIKLQYQGGKVRPAEDLLQGERDRLSLGENREGGIEQRKNRIIFNFRVFKSKKERKKFQRERFSRWEKEKKCVV